MSELSESIVAAFRKKTTSAAVGTYLFFWASLHWQGLYAALFVSEGEIWHKYGLLKNEYLNRYFFGIHGLTDWNGYLGYLIPLVLTVLFIWPLPKFVLIWFYQLEQEHKTDRLRIKYREEQKRKSFEITAIRKEEARITAKTSLAKKRNTAAKTDPKIVWDTEYQAFEKDPAFKSFTYILQAIYEHNGRTRVSDPIYNSVEFEVPGAALYLADTLGLITIAATNGAIRLTDKGKYFASKYPHYANR